MGARKTPSVQYLAHIHNPTSALHTHAKSIITAIIIFKKATRYEINLDYLYETDPITWILYVKELPLTPALVRERQMGLSVWSTEF